MFSEDSSRRFLRGHQPKNQLVCHDTPPPHLTNRNCSALVLIRKDNRISMRGLKLAGFFLPVTIQPRPQISTGSFSHFVSPTNFPGSAPLSRYF